MFYLGGIASQRKWFPSPLLCLEALPGAGVASVVGSLLISITMKAAGCTCLKTQATTKEVR